MIVERLPKLRISIINKCQLKCIFCGGNDTHMENFQPYYLNDSLLDYSQLIEIIKSYIEMGGRYIQFTGGEPLLYRGIVKLTKQIAELGGIVEINTNGIALDENMAENLSSNGLNVIKVSIPSFRREKYREATGVDALDRVLKNVEHAKIYLKIRINTVALKSHFDEIELAIDTCRSLGIKQLLFLELLYYYDIKNDSKTFFESEYVNIKKEFGPTIERKLESTFNHFEFYSEYENTLKQCVSKSDGFEVYYKQATTTLRTSSCELCDHFCQEGIYELRLSTGGYISFCNVTNDNGHNVSKASKEETSNIFKEYLNIFSNGYISDFYTFKYRHCIKLEE